MAAFTDKDRLAAVKRKLNITWQEQVTEERISDVMQTASPALATRLGYTADHAFSPDDGGAWSLYLNACLYEWSDALDDFWRNYAEEIRTERLLITKGEHVGGE